MSGRTGRPTAFEGARTLELDISGMTCASCAARIEKKLNKVALVQASVNYATERATVIAPLGVTDEQLIGVVEAAGYGASLPVMSTGEPDDAVGRLQRRMVVAIAASTPVIAVAMVPPWQFPGWQWVSLVLATVVVWWCGWGFHRAALVNARHRSSTMDTLVSLGTTAAYAWSLYALLFGHAGMIGMRHEFEFVLRRSDGAGNVYFEAACGIITFLLIGRYIEARSKHEAGAALRALLELGAKDAVVLRDGVECRVPIGAVKVGDLVVVRPGEKVATDGEVVEGASAVDNSLLTGESVPVEVTVGEGVIGGAINANGRLVIRAGAVGADTQLAHIGKLMEQAQAGKANVQRLADRVSGFFVPVVIVIALVTLVAWLLAGAGAGFAFTAAVAVLIIACPCALGLATPTALLVGTGRGAQLGIVIRGPEVLETARGIDTVLLDKTGTITTGQMSVTRVVPAGVSADELLAVAAAVEAASEHPIARAVVAAGAPSAGRAPSGGNTAMSDVYEHSRPYFRRKREDGKGEACTDFENLPGLGVRGTVGGCSVVVGSAALVSDAILVSDVAPAPDGAPTPDIAPAPDAAATPSATLMSDVDAAATVVHVAWDGVYRGRIEVGDTVKPTSARAIAEFKALGLMPVLLSGDRRAVAERVAREVGINEVIAEALPADKVAHVRTLQASGRRVAMIGDGVNDAAALTQADLGIAMGEGTDVAIAASDLTLMRPDLLLAADAVALSRRTLRTIKANLFWAFAYNVAAIPMAAAGLLNPMFAGAAMACSSVFVVLNSLRLRRFQPTRSYES